MVDITMPEMKELAVHHIYKVSKNEIIKSSLTPQGMVRPLFWCDGILFNFYMLPLDAEGVANDYLKGKEHWAEVFWTEQSKYTDMVELDEDQFKGVKVRVINVDTFSPHKEFIKWLKTKEKK